MLELWGGIECTVNRVGDRYIDQIVLTGDVPSPANPPTGCHFHPRCPYAQDKCKQETPEWKEYRPSHFAACHFAETVAGTSPDDVRPTATSP